MSIENVSKDTDKITENVPDSESKKTRDKIDNLSKMSLILRDKNKGQNSSLFEKKNLGSVPESSEEQVQVQGGYASAPCNPVTLSFTLNLGAYKKEGKK
jgi:hypothetical protein